MAGIPVAIAFSGAIGSGKSSLSRAVADSLICSRISFGAQVRSEAAIRNLDSSRETLQALGEELVRDDIENFCKSVLGQAPADPSRPLVIDGLRHVEVLDMLQKLLSPRPVRLIYITLDHAARAARLGRDLTVWDSHSTELQVADTLRNRADLSLYGDDTTTTLCAAVVNWVRNMPHH